MKFLSRLAVSFYMIIILFLGTFLFLFAIREIPYVYSLSYQNLLESLFIMYHDSQIRLFIGGVGVVLLLANYFFWMIFISQSQRGKTIAFDNPSGRVSVSLSALEDLIRRVIKKIPEVKEVRSVIGARRDRLEVDCSLVLNADVNIPAMTSRVQELVKRKIQNTIGIEQAVTVRVDVVKIIPDKQKGKDERSEDDDLENHQPTIPFQGYRA